MTFVPKIPKLFIVNILQNFVFVSLIFLNRLAIVMEFPNS